MIASSEIRPTPIVVLSPSLSSMLRRRWERVGLAVLLIAFVAIKWAYLPLPFYWDECWVYAPAVRAMHNHGPSLLPGSIGTDLSRGHPLLFHFLASCWSMFFGTAPVSLHGFALFVATVLLVLIYWVGRQLGSEQVGLAATALVLMNETFLAQSGLLLPEVMLALFALGTIHCYVQGRALAYVVLGTCTLWVKETGAIIVLAIIIWQLLRPKSPARAKSWYYLAPLPLFTGSTFYLYQRFTYGWFFYPEHLGLMNWDLTQFLYTVKYIYSDLMEDQGRVWGTYLFGLIAPLAWGGIRLVRAALVVLAYVAAVKVLFNRWPLPPLWALVAIPACVALVHVLIQRPYAQVEPKRGAFLGIGTLVFGGMVVFSAINFFTERYLVCLIPLIALCTLAFVHSALRNYHPCAFAATAGLTIVFTGMQLRTSEKVGDNRLSYRDDIQVEQQAIDHCKALGLQDEAIYASFLEGIYMTDPEAGYLKGAPAFKNVSQTLDERSSYALFTHATHSELQAQREKLDMVRMARFSSGDAWSEVYRKP